MRSLVADQIQHHWLTDSPEEHSFFRSVDPPCQGFPGQRSVASASEESRWGEKRLWHWQHALHSPFCDNCKHSSQCSPHRTSPNLPPDCQTVLRFLSCYTSMNWFTWGASCSLEWQEFPNIHLQTLLKNKKTIPIEKNIFILNSANILMLISRHFSM